MNFNIPNSARIAINTLEGAGFSAYLVGGCVRDYILGKTPLDFDITTNAIPDEMKKVFVSFRTIETGIKHGTLTVLLENDPIEITTFRRDGEYKDHRKPESVTFTDSLKEDLLRRDFTMNAIAFNPKCGIIDYFGGEEDIKNKIIRAVGNPVERFNEDALRILRALRFASILGFEIEAETAKAARELSPLLKQISSERILAELRKLVCGDGARQVLLNFPDIIGVFLPEILPSVGFDQRNPHHIYDVYTHSVIALSHCPKNANLRLAALFHDTGKPSTFKIGEDGYGHFYGHAEESVKLAERALRRLKIDNNSLKTILTVVKYHDSGIENAEKSVKRWLRKIGKIGVNDLLAFKMADNLAQSPNYSERLQEYEQIHATTEKIIENDECFSLKNLAVNGHDLIKLGFPKGKQLGVVLEDLLFEVIEHGLENSKEEIIKYLTKKYQ